MGLGRHAFSLKNTRDWRGWSCVTLKFTVRMKPRRNLYAIHNDFLAVGGGLRRGCILIRNRDGDEANIPLNSERGYYARPGWGAAGSSFYISSEK